MTDKAPLNPLLLRQVAKATGADGRLDLDVLFNLVSTAYDEKALDRRRSDRANRLMAEELEAVARISQVQNIRFKAALDTMNQGLCLFDADGLLAVCNRRFREIYGIDDGVSLERASLQDILHHSRMFQAAKELDRRLLLTEHALLDKAAGASIDQVWPGDRTLSISRTKVADGGYLDTIDDVTETRRASAQIAHLARHDALTDLPNRVALRDWMGSVGRGTGRSHAMLCLDLDRFKFVNDTLGHSAGDALLVQVAARLTSCVDGAGLVARLGGDEFAVALPDIKSRQVPIRLAARIIAALTSAFQIDGHRVQIGASVGIFVAPSADFEPQEAMRKADLALYQAKARGRGKACVFTSQMDESAQQRRTLEEDLRRALDLEQFVLVYQAQVDTRSHRIQGFEALLRWRHPERGEISPGDFIPICEENGLIHDLGAQVLRRACREAALWPAPIGVSVNLSPVQFRSDHLPALVADALAQSGLAPERLELEITEGVMLQGTRQVLEQLQAIKAIGCRIALDDFGTGYSSLNYLRSFAFDRIKIDRSFIQDAHSNPDSLAIVRAVSGLCDSLGIQSTAEGVETDDQLSVVRGEGCEMVQGFLFSKPVPHGETLALLSGAGTWDRLTPPVRAAG